MQMQVSFDRLTREKFIIDKPVRLIEVFAGIGAVSKALTRLGVKFEHYRAIDFCKYKIAAYNAIHGTGFTPVDIRKLKGAELQITNIDKYLYIFSYTYPCTSISTAGKRDGMSEGSGTASSLLWEVRRILDEVGNLPQLLLMENVTQVHGSKNIDDFRKWIEFLEQKGYTSFYSDLNAADYGIPQNRKRCFMVSLLGNYYYEFPEEIQLNTTLGDVLESSADKKYFLSEAETTEIVKRLEKMGCDLS